MLTGNFPVPSLDENPRDLTLPVLNHDVVTHVLDHLLLVRRPRNQGERVLSLSKLTTYQILPKFYREILLVTPKALCATLDTLECCPHLTSQVQTLYVTAQPLIVTLCAVTLQSLAIGNLSIRTITDPILVCAFRSLTELAIPIRLLSTPNSPFVRHVDFDYPVDNSNPTWPRVHSLWTWTFEPPNFALNDFQHFGSLTQSALVSHSPYTSNIGVYLFYLQARLVVEHAVVVIAQHAPGLPLPQAARNPFFFDPSGVFYY
ncbi:hypothetical protein V5O48_002152 [Marasmius crinis-equi]|uniref:Uncharacterized protein n=1 Tax=Marasmius crinis-equi TaxID=585013 RepID=A0ABR3FWD2_9AGAR